MVQTFSTNSHIPLFTGAFTAADLADLLTAVDALVDGGKTNYEAALVDAQDWFLGQVAATDGFTNFELFLSDGQATRYLDDAGNVQSGNSTVSLNEALDAAADMINQTGLLSGDDKVLVNAIGMGGAQQLKLDQIDNTGGSVIVDLGDPSALEQTILDSLIQTFDVGADVIVGGAGDDVIFGDLPNTDALALDILGQGEDLNLLPGAGWFVFQALEAGSGLVSAGWDRADTVDYLRNNVTELSAGGRGKADVIDGGAGDDIISGQGGADVITGGAGEDLFIYSDGDGGLTLAEADVITDFEDGLDMFDLSGTSAASFADVTIGVNGSDATIMVASTSEILAVVTGAAGQLDASDFVF